MPTETQAISLAQLIGALSYALDMAEGEPPGHATRTCLISMRLAEEISLDEEAQGDLRFAALLKDAGCSANSARMAALFGADDRKAKQTSKRVDWARPLPAFVWAVRTVAPRRSLRARADRLRAIHDEGAVTRSLMLARCERGAEIACKLGFTRATADAIRALDEHWDGRGQPFGLRGNEIPLLARIVCLAQTLDVFRTTDGTAAAVRVAKQRKGEWFDPEVVDALAAFSNDSGFWASLRQPQLSSLELPGHVVHADEDRLDRIADGFAQIIDAKSPWTYRHSARVHAIVRAIGERLSFDSSLQRELGRAALLHDIGKLSISNRILDKRAPLTDVEVQRIREHPIVTERVLEQVPGFSDLAALAGSHHERLDGGGYPRGLRADDLTMPMRVLAMADCYEALTAHRPYRPPHSHHQALEIMQTDVPKRLDGDVFTTLQALSTTASVKPRSGWE